jgi:hypothetical protein
VILAPLLHPGSSIIKTGSDRKLPVSFCARKPDLLFLLPGTFKFACKVGSKFIRSIAGDFFSTCKI